MSKKLVNLLLGTAVTLSLGYGATQAFASSAVSEPPYCATAQERAECAVYCQSIGLVGYCYQETGCSCEIM
jgi:hypothetical protein